MGFRDYNPGLNRFTTRDMYNGALADMNLGMDPYSGNRYAFTGGNPISRVEYDGHMICSEPGVCGSDPYLTQYYENQASKSDDSDSDFAPVPVEREIKAGVVAVGPVGGLKQAEKWVLPRIISLFKTDPVKIHWGEIFEQPEGLTDPQWDTVVDNCQATYGLRESQCRDLPVFVVDGKQTPKIAINDASAIAAGQPFLLHYNGGGKAKTLNRELAGCTSWWQRGGGVQSCDEYPFASTQEGGLGSQVMGVPGKEQQIQGTKISAFYRTNKIKKGDPFLVAVINVRQVNGIYVAP